MKKLLSLLILTAVVASLPFGYAAAVNPDEVLANPVLESRAREISTELRCVVCQNQSIDDSDADIARDLRLLVRERLVAGDNDKEVVAYVVARYGDFVLLRPPFQMNTLALWFGPPLFALVIASLIVLFYRTYQSHQLSRQPLNPLSPFDRAELDALVNRVATTTPPASARRSGFRAELSEGLAPEQADDLGNPDQDTDAARS